MEVMTETDDVTEYSHDNQPGTGVFFCCAVFFAFIYLCTMYIIFLCFHFPISFASFVIWQH